MKKIFLSLFVAGALTFGLQSCAEDDPCDGVTCGVGEICDDGNCVTDPNANCDVCGSYDGTLNGNVTIPGVTVPPLEDVNTDVTVSASGADYTLVVDLSQAIVPGLQPTVVGTYNATTKVITFTDAEYSFDVSGTGDPASLLEFLINGTATYNGSNQLDIDIVLSSPAGATNQASGDLNVVATK